LPFGTVFDGSWKAVEDERSSLGIDARLILCFLQDRSTEESEAVLDLALPHRGRILAVGMDNGTKPWGARSTIRFRDMYALGRSPRDSDSSLTPERRSKRKTELERDVIE
jgi:adenosine deaminase